MANGSQRLMEKDISEDACKIAFVGDSITWGEGLLEDDFVGAADRFLRARAALTRRHSELAFTGEKRTVRNLKLLGGSAAMLEGAGSEVSFEWPQERLVLIQAIQRTNARASLIDVYVDGELADSFSNYNEQDEGAETISFNGDGTTGIFDLGRAFTFDHAVRLDGELLKGGLNVKGYGGDIPAGDDYMVIRKVAAASPQGGAEVRHYVRFRAAPPRGARIGVSFRYGESIAYARTTVGETGEGLDSPLESRYGEGGVAFDPARPSPVSSGLDFRMSDMRAARSWAFGSAAKRRITFRIRGLDPRALPNEVPYFIVNAVTDRFHEVMNAGIGGWTARLFNDDPALRNVSLVTAWKPDIVFIGLGTNDDWEEGNAFVASRVQVMDEERVRRSPVLFLKSCKPLPGNRYRTETADLLVSAVTERSVTIDRRDSVFGDVRSGDMLVIGDYYGDNRNVLFRIIDAWEPDTCTAHFREPLTGTPLTEHIGGFVGQAVRIKRMDGFIGQLSRMIGKLRSDLPTVPIVLLETGLSNFYTRLLTGYSTKLKRFAAENGLACLPVYEDLLQWQYAQERDLRVYIGPELADTSTGEAEYTLVTEGGRDVHEHNGYGLRNWSVLVDGEERYGDCCRIEGGYAIAFRPEAESEALLVDNWNGRVRNPAVCYRFIPSKLLFTARAPKAGSRIEVNVSLSKWSPDDAHLSLEGGKERYADLVEQALESWLKARFVSE